MPHKPISRRRFFHLLGYGSSATLLSACTNLTARPTTSLPPTPTPVLAIQPITINTPVQPDPTTGRFELPALPYNYADLEPYIDQETMQLHYNRHHAGYVNKLNDALQQYPDALNRSLDEILANLDSLPEDIRTLVQQNGGGHSNHTLFWLTMRPDGGGEPSGDLAAAIAQNFGSFAAFQAEMTDAASGVFGSGWAWLVLDPNGQLLIYRTHNQDSPFMQGHTPILGIDVWEHAYYLTYQNRRADYIAAWWNIVNWDAVAERYSYARSLAMRSGQ